MAKIFYHYSNEFLKKINKQLSHNPNNNLMIKAQFLVTRTITYKTRNS